MRDAFFGADILLGLLEDGGEMVAITAACVLAAAMVRQLAVERAEATRPAP